MKIQTTHPYQIGRSLTLPPKNRRVLAERGSVTRSALPAEPRLVTASASPCLRCAAAHRAALRGQGADAPRQTSRRHAFTLVEMLLVVTIIGILAALVIPRIAGTGERARVTAAQADINGGLKSALGQYEVDCGFYPKNLQDLLVQPGNARNWHGPYLEKLPVDPWGNPYVYHYPGKHIPGSYDLLSVGPDGKEGTEDDVVSWQ